jgi:hypothetical protein
MSRRKKDDKIRPNHGQLSPLETDPRRHRDWDIYSRVQAPASTPKQLA